MFKVLRQYFYSLLVGVFLFNLVGCDDAELENPTGIGVYALRNETKRQLYFKIDGDSIFMDTSSIEVIRVHNEPNGPAHPILGLPSELNFFYHDTPIVDLLAIKIETKKMHWTPRKLDSLLFGHVEYLDTLEEFMLKK